MGAISKPSSEAPRTGGVSVVVFFSSLLPSTALPLPTRTGVESATHSFLVPAVAPLDTVTLPTLRVEVTSAEPPSVRGARATAEVLEEDETFEASLLFVDVVVSFFASPPAPVAPKKAATGAADFVT